MNVQAKALATVVVSALLLAPSLALAKGGPPAPAAPASLATADGLLDHPRDLARFLRLTPDQVKQLMGFYQTLEAAVQPLRDARPALCTQLRTDLGAAAPDPNAVGADTISLFDNKQQIRAAREAFDTSFSAILTPDQLARWDALKHLVNFLNGPGVDILGDCPPAS
jgi:Spy/CpxP family protein refolding chaperone